MEVLLDSNFIISSIKRGINFVEELESLGFKVLLPKEVYLELKDLKLKLPHDDRVAIELALELFSKANVKKITLGANTVDEGLILKGKKGYYVATLDNAIKRMVPNKVIIEDSSNSCKVERS